ncbi:hypothetical protein QFZ31_000765 [Neobacillus niacini]|uniref:hypothetical protein n=1 Tax=Neobacillus driksii TaxID=3035913 RepID=UPI00277F0EFD|nr:hypothetical protein [Neobacillus niacini]MDQ0970887.1 hypothetical protein [Neobacillus niacini]
MKSKIHRCNCRKVWSIQNRKFKITVQSILLTGEWIAELKPERKCEPKGFVTTKKSREIVYNPTSKYLENFTIIDKLIYDKKNVNFNIKNGKCLFFAEDGTCYILKKET